MPDIQFDDKNVAFNNTDAALVFCIAKTTKPYKPFALAAEKDKNGKDTGWYTVPKSMVFAHRAEKLADGSRVSVMRTKSVPRNERMALFDAGIASGLKVRPLEEEKTSKPDKPAALTLETLTGGAVKL